MFWEIADELYALSREALKETKSQHSLSKSMKGPFMYGLKRMEGANRAGFDGIYDIYNRDILEELSLDNYEVARKHLERLLKEHT